jgi:hypothetical protein
MLSKCWDTEFHIPAAYSWSHSDIQKKYSWQWPKKSRCRREHLGIEMNFNALEWSSTFDSSEQKIDVCSLLSLSLLFDWIRWTSRLGTNRWKIYSHWKVPTLAQCLNRWSVVINSQVICGSERQTSGTEFASNGMYMQDSEMEVRAWLIQNSEGL